MKIANLCALPLRFREDRHPWRLQKQKKLEISCTPIAEDDPTMVSGKDICACLFINKYMRIFPMTLYECNKTVTGKNEDFAAQCRMRLV